jgi:hypothetical protein
MPFVLVLAEGSYLGFGNEVVLTAIFIEYSGIQDD